MHFDPTVSLGNLVSAVTFLFLAGLAWSDLRWRVRNLEIWRKENMDMWKCHLTDAKERDALLQKMDKTIDHLGTLVASIRGCA